MSTVMRVSEALKWASSFLKINNREESAAEWLMMHFLDWNRTQLMMHLGDPLDSEILKVFKEAIEKHVAGTPVQYIAGRETFYGREFQVNEEVLIPRPETEELVEEILLQSKDFFHFDKKLKVVDIGTGSGAIAISLALENPAIEMTAIDIAKESLQVAKQNADKLGASVRFIHGDLLQPLIIEQSKYAIIVSNPPYIPDEEVLFLDPLVKDHEPVRALAGGKDGYDFYRRLMVEIPQVIAPKGIIAFEVGYDQARTVEKLLQETFGSTIKTSVRKDINGKERIVIGLVEKF